MIWSQMPSRLWRRSARGLLARDEEAIRPLAVPAPSNISTKFWYPFCGGLFIANLLVAAGSGRSAIHGLRAQQNGSMMDDSLAGMLPPEVRTQSIATAA